jgi:iron complex outermembrane receptor protein
MTRPFFRGAHVLSASVLTAAMAFGAHAQAPLPQAGTRLQAAVPAQPLAQALSAISRQAGIAIGADAALLSGKTAPALRAGLTLQQALEQALAGTGLVAVGSGPSAIAVQARPPASPSAALPAVTVTARADTETATGPVAGYVARRSTAGSKTDSLLVETPQSVSVVTRDELRSRQAETLAQALGYTPGVTSEPTSFNRTADRFRIRGMDVEAATGGSLRDGLRLQGNSYDGVQEPYGLERVEVVRGAASVLYGQLSPGGLVNAVSKRPTSTPLREIGVQVGSHNRKQLTADFSGPLSDTLDYRLTFLGRDSDTAQSYLLDDKIYIAPSLSWRPSAATSLTLLSFYQKTSTRFAAPLPYQLVEGFGTGPFRIRRGAFIGEPGYDEMRGEMYALGYELEHAFSDSLKLSHRARYFKSNVNWNYLQAQTSAAAIRAAATTGVLQRQYSDRRERPEGLSTDTRLEWTVHHGTVEHRVLLGLGAYKTEWDSTNFRANAPSLNLATYAYGQPVTVVRNPTVDRGSRIDTQQAGLYLQDQINLGEHWTVLLGLRHDWADQEQTLHRNQAKLKQDNEATTWRAGLVHKFANGWAPYLSYSESFYPVSAAEANGQQFKPTRGKQVEAGVRYQPQDRNMLLSAAVFELTQTNVLKYDAGRDAYLQAGEVRSRGLELEAKAEVARSLNLIASYAYIDARITRSTVAAEIGQRSEDTPYHQAALWLDYGFAQWGLPDLTVGLGARYKGTTRASGIATALPAYTVLDALVRYRIDPHWDFSLNVANLANKKITHCEFAICRYGDERQALGTLSYRW